MLSYHQRKYREARRAGNCASCWRRKATCKSLCRSCHARIKRMRSSSVYKARLNRWGITQYRRRKRAGRCVACGNLPRKNRVHCHRCSKKTRVYAKRYRASVAPQLTAYQREWNYQIRSEIIRLLGNQCVCCGERWRPFLQIDHTQSDGNKHRATFSSLAVFLRAALRSLQVRRKLQVLCANCHVAKTGRRVCPGSHQEKKGSRHSRQRAAPTTHRLPFSLKICCGDPSALPVGGLGIELKSSTFHQPCGPDGRPKRLRSIFVD